MAYNAIEKQRLEEYERNLKLVGTNKSSVNMPQPTNVPGATNYLPTKSGETARDIKAAQAKAENDKWFKKSAAFDDGYQIGDISKAVGSSAADVGLNVVKGAGSIVEGLTDTLTYGAAAGADLIGQKQTADRMRKSASENSWVDDMMQPAIKKVEKNSVFGNKSDAIGHGIGYYGGMLALQAVGVPWEATAAVTSYGGSYGEALREGATSSQAFLFGVGSATAEILSEKVFSGINLPRTGKNILNTEKLIETQTDKIKNELIKKLVKFGISSLGEGAEEIISGVATETAKKLIYSNEWNYSTEDAWNDFVAGTIVAGITGGAQNLMYKGGNINSLEINNKGGVTTINELVEQEKNKSNTNINTNIDINTNAEAVAITARINEVNNELNGYIELQQENKLTNQQQQQMIELQTELKNLQEQLDTLNKNSQQNSKNLMPVPVNDLVAKENSAKTNSSRQILPLGNDLTKNSINIQETTKTLPARNLNLIESARINNIDPNSEPIISINKMLSDRGINSRFDANLFSDSNANAIWMTNVNENGETVREIIFNPNADTKQLIQEVAIHELYHDMVAGGNADLLADLIESFNMQFPDFQKARQELARTYSKVYQNSNNFEQAVNEEVVANILAQKLGSQEYINRLVHEKPSLAKQIYDFVIDKLNRLNRLVGYRSEKIFWEDVKNKFEKAYREEYKKNKKVSDAKYSYIGNEGAENLKNNTNYQNIKNDLAYAKFIHNNSFDNLETTNKESIEKTGWFKDKNGDWKFELDDSKAKIDLSNVEGGKKYKVTDILDYQEIIQAYPELADYYIKFTKMDGSGEFVAKDKLIKVNKNKLNIKNIATKEKTAKATILHEIQHLIQKTEGFELEAHNFFDTEGYIHDLGEVEAQDIRDRINYNADERKAILPESAKNNPIHSQADKIRNSGNAVDKLGRKIYNAIKGRGFYEISENNIPISSEHLEKETRNDSRLLRYGQGGLDNSSFSYRGSHQIQNASMITDLNLDEIQQKVIEVNGSLSKQDYSDLNKLKKILKSPNENVKIYRASPVHELNNGDWVTTDKAYAKNVADQNGGKVYEYEVKANQLYYPDNVKELPSLHRLSSFQYNNSFSSQLENQGTKIMEESISKREGMIENFKTFLEENNITNPTQQDIDNSIVDMLGYDNEQTSDENARDEKLYNQYVREYMKENNISFNDSNNTKYSQNNSKWQEYLNKHYQREGTGQTLKELKTIEEKAQEVTSENRNLTDEEAQELYVLENLPFDLDQQESERLEYLKNKEKGYKVKFPELKKTITYNDIKSEYSKYRDLTNFDAKQLKTAKQYVPGYKNTDKRTKQQWLNVANFIGSNIKTDSSKELTKYAIQSWFSAKPNTKDTLNRQGQKYVKFSIEDWVNEVYKGAGVGSLIKTNNVLPVKASISTSNQSNADNNQLIPIDSNKLKKVMNPTEISKLTKQDANTTPILPTRKVQTGKGESSFARNISEKTNMLSENSKKSILSSNEVNYYKQVTNEESLNKAFDKINKGGQSEVYSWMTKSSENATSVDIAEGWILLKQYQDQIQNETDTSKKDDLNRSMVEVAKKMREMGTKAGQTVQAFNIMNRLTPEGMVYYAQSELQEAYEKMSKNKTKEWIDANRENFELTPEDTQFIMNNMEEIRDMEDGYDKRVKLAEIQKLMTDKLPPEKGAALKSWMRISMLFNPKTQVRNVAGNALIAPINYFGDLFSSYADKIIAKKTGVRTTGNMNVNAILKGMKEGAYQSTNDYKKGINTKDMEGNRFEITEGKSFNDKTTIGKSLNRVEALLNYVMDAGDRVFSQASFENSLQNQMILNNTTEITQDMIDIARAESLQRTWNDNNEYTKFVLNVRKGLNKLSFGDYGLGDVLIPFAKTPANLTKAIVDYSPAGLIKTIVEGKNLKNSLSNGQYNAKMQHKFVQDLGKATAGTMLYVLGYALANAGITGGESDDDKDTANFIKNTLGISSYSIKIGDKSFTYDWAQPLAAPLSITANIVNSRNNKEQALLEGIVGSLDTAGSILLEQSFLQSINEVLTDNEGFVTGLINSMLDLPARAVPTFSKQIADLVDGTQRTTFEYDKPLQTAVNKVKAKIPFLSKTLSPTVDTMGREIQKYGGKNNIFNVFLNPANVNTENISTSAAEIYRLYKTTGDKTIMPRVAPYYINKNGEKTIMTSQQRTEYQKIAGGIIESNIKKMINDSKYINLSDVEKAEMINKIVNYSYNKARKDVLGMEMSDTYNKINLYTNDGGNVSDYYLNKDEIDYSYQYPEKYKTIKQITTYDKYLTYQNEISNIKDRYENTNQRKNAVVNYVNSLELTIPQKAMLIRMNYSSFNSYDNQIIEYINSQDLTIKEKEDILSKLGFKIKDGRVYTK